MELHITTTKNPRVISRKKNNFEVTKWLCVAMKSREMKKEKIELLSMKFDLFSVQKSFSLFLFSSNRPKPRGTAQRWLGSHAGAL